MRDHPAGARHPTAPRWARTGRSTTGRNVRLAVCGVLTAAALTGCAADSRVPGSPAGGSAASPHGGGHAGPGVSGGAHGVLPGSHVHGVGVNPGDGLVYLATHDGLFRYEDAGPVRVGGSDDLMGFTIAGPDHFYASGHPGPGSDLPEPMGLVESTDAGRTWTPLSRQGRSDFHALTVSGAGVLGFDGTLRASADGRTWQEVAVPAAPYSLAASPEGTTVLATTEEGPLRSGDGGRSWAPVAGAPLLLLVDWASGGTVVGLTPQGVTAVSTDAGATWELRGSTGDRPQALGASGEGELLRVDAVTTGALLTSTDGGRTYGEPAR
ncbi:hypothetical protein NUM3379_24040 [Kineococcus sp. NUM-3379]